MKELEVVYTCHGCKREFKPKELYDMEEFEEGEWEYSCPTCKRPLKWGLK